MVVSCRAETRTDSPIEVEVRHVGFDRVSNSPVVILQDKDKKRVMPIWIGIAEAQAIALELQGTPSARPLTHDLLKNILEQVGVEFQKVVVNELKGSTYYARIYLVAVGKALEIDSRPSDAIALALRFHRPIFVVKTLFDSALPAEGVEGAAKPISAKVSGVTVQDLTADLAAYFNLSRTEGVLVVDGGVETDENHLQRGDIVVAVGGETVRDVADLRRKLSKERGHLMTLRVQRDGKELGVQLTVSEEELSEEGERR
jgi:bifunctional DNase/RNase